MNALQTLPTEGIKPKPTKKELIEALAVIQHQKLHAEIEEKELHSKECFERCAIAILNYMQGRITTFISSISHGYLAEDGKLYGCSLDLDISGDILPVLLRNQLGAAIEFHNTIPRRPSLNTVRDDIKNSFASNSSERVDALISNPESKAALEKILQTLNQ